MRPLCHRNDMIYESERLDILSCLCDEPCTVDCRDRIFVITCMLEKLDEVVSGNNSGRYDISNGSHATVLIVGYGVVWGMGGVLLLQSLERLNDFVAGLWI